MSNSTSAMSVTYNPPIFSASQKLGWETITIEKGKAPLPPAYIPPAPALTYEPGVYGGKKPQKSKMTFHPPEAVPVAQTADEVYVCGACGSLLPVGPCCEEYSVRVKKSTLQLNEEGKLLRAVAFRKQH